MEHADRAETRKADRPREREEGEEPSDDDVTPPDPIQIAAEARDFELPDPEELRKIESDTQSRLKAILEVAGVTGLSQIDAQTFQDPEILRKLTNSVSSALDEAATALTRMKSERGSYEAFLRGAHQPAPPSPPLTTTPSPSPNPAPPRPPGDGHGTLTPQGPERAEEEGGRGGAMMGAGAWVQSHDVVQGGNGGLQVQSGASGGLKIYDGPAASEVGRGESIKTMHRLLTQGQNIQDASEDGESLLSLACSAGYYELAEVLLRMKASVEDRGVKGDSTPLMEAASGGYADIVKLLIAHKASVNAKSSAGNTALTYACCGGYEDVVKLLLDAGAEVEHQNENGHTPLMEAASCGHVGVAKLLLDYGANINTHSNEFKESALTLACYKGHLEMVKYLLNAGADQEHKTDEMHTALMEASMDGHVDVARLLLDHGAQVNMPVDSFESPLTLAACGGHYDLVALLISRGADLEEVNDEGYTPLMEASREGHEEVVTLLVEHGAHVNAQTEETQETALTLACCGGFLEVVQYLIEHGADIELGASTPLMEASQEGHVEIVNFLIKRGANVEAETSTQDTALTYSSANGHTIISDILLQCGARLEHECEGGRTPLMKAARAGHLQTVQFLAGKGADINRKTASNDHTVLSLACSGGHISTVQFLLGEGASPTHILRDNATMLTEASRGGHLTVANLLLRQPRVVPSPHHSSTRASKAHYERIKFASGRKPHSRNVHHHHHHHQQHSSHMAQSKASQKPAMAQPTESASTLTQNNHSQVSSTSQQDNGNSKTQRKTQASLAGVGGQGEVGGGESVGSAKRQKVADDSRHQPTSEGDPPEDVPPRNILRVGPSGSNPNDPPPSRSDPIRSTVSTSDRSTTQPASYAAPAEGQLTPEDVLVRCMLQMAQARSTVTEPTSHPHTAPPVPSTTPSSAASYPHTAPPVPSTTPSSAASYPHTAPPVPSTTPSSAASYPHTAPPVPSTTPSSAASYPNTAPPVPSTTPSSAASYPNTSVVTTPSSAAVVSTSTTSSSVQRDSKSVKLLESGNSMFSRGNFAPLDHIPHTHPSQSSSSLPHPPLKFHTKGKPSTTPSTLTSGTMTSSSTMTSSTSPPPHAHPTPAATSTASAFTNADISRLIPHLEAIAGSLQNSPSLETHCLAALAQSHLLPALAQYDPDTPQAAEMLEALQNLPLLTADGKTIPLTNSAAIDSASFLTSLDMNALMQNLASPELQGANPATDVQAQPVYPADFGSLKRLSQKMQSAAMVESSMDQAAIGGGGGQRFETDMLPNRTRPLTTSFLLDHNFPMDIPPPTDLLPDHLPLPSGYVPTIENESYLSSEEDDLEEEGSDTSYLAQEIALPPGSYDPAIEIDQQTDSNHDTALTLAAAGGHDELVELLISHGANIEHRDKKGCTPLILAASAGHAVTVASLLDHAADIEAQSDRTKDTALSLACSGGRQEVVEILLSKGANFEHRNVSDYTPLSLAASGGYVNIIKMLLRAGADINSRTGSKLGITPLMLAAMNGHTPTVKLLLDMGSDINAQIETNRNTALTLACFQGRHEVVSLLVERQANVEHRAKTGLTPLMEAASGGYHEVGRVLINRGADVNAAPVPSSKDTALTIAADKGHYRFVELILREGAHVDVKNKKGNSPLWLAANGGHLDVVRLLVDHGSDLDSQDNRKVSCLMAAFRKGHFKVVKFLVDHVTQFPSDAELTRYVSTLSDKENLKKSQRCMEVIIDAKERQAAEANKNATILLQEIDQEKKHEEDRKAAAARKRAKKKRQKEKKQALKAQRGDKVGEKGGVGGGVGDSPPEGDHVDDPADDVMAENGETPDDLSPVDRIPPKDPLPLSLPLTKKQSPSERDRMAGEREGSRVSSRLGRLLSTSSMTGIPGGVVSPGGTTPTSSPRKGKKEDGWKEVGKRTKKVSVPGSAFTAVVGKNNCNLLLIRQATNTHIEIERTSKTASTRALSIRGSTEAIKQAQHIISQLVRDPTHNIASVLPKFTHPPPHSITSSHPHSYKSHSIPHDPSIIPQPSSALFEEHRVPPSSATTAPGIHTNFPSSSLTSSLPTHAAMRATIAKRSSISSGVTTTCLARASTVNSFPVTTTKTGKTLGNVGDKRHSAPQSVLAAADLRYFAAGVTTTSQTRQVTTSVVTNAAMVKFSTPLTPTSGAVRRLFTTTAVHSGPMQTGAVVSVAQTTALPMPTPAQGIAPSQSSGTFVPPPPRVPPVTTVVMSQQQYMVPFGKSSQPYPATSLASTNVTKGLPSHAEHYEALATKTDAAPSAVPGTNISYSRVIGSHLTNQMPSPTLIEQPFQQIMKTPTIFQEPATQLTKPKKYSDAVGKKLSDAVAYSATKLPVMSGNPLVTAPPPLPPPSLPPPPLSLPPSHPPSLPPSSLTSSLPPSIPLPLSVAPVLNLAPGTRPVMAEEKTLATSYPQSMSDKFKSSTWSDRDLVMTEHRQTFEEDDRLPHAPNLGPIGPPSKMSKPPGGTRGDIGPPGRAEGGRFSPIGSRGARTSPNSAMTASPQRSSDPSPVAKSPLLGPAPPGGLLPTPEKLYTGFRPIQSQSSQEFTPGSTSERGREADVIPLTPTPVRTNPRPPLLATPPGFPPPFLPQGVQSPIHSKPGQKPASPVQTVSPDKISPNKSPPQLPPSSKGFNPNAPTFVPMGLQGVQRPANTPPTSSILGPPPISKLTNFPPPVGSSILGNAPPIGTGPRMVGPNIHPSQPPPQPPPPPPSGGQTSILGQPPAPSINPHIFNPPPMPPAPGQQTFPPKPPNPSMFGQFESNQHSPGVLQPPMPPFGIIFPGAPQAQQNFVGQPNQNYSGGTKEFLPGSMEGGPFLPNPISQQPMMTQGPPPTGSSEISRFGVPLMKAGKSEPEAPDPMLGVTSAAQNISLPCMLMTSEAGTNFDSGPSHPQMVRTGNMFGMGMQQTQPGLRPVPQDTATPPSSTSSILGTTLDMFPTFLPMSCNQTVATTGVTSAMPHSTIMMVSPSVFSAVPTTTAGSSHDPSSGGGSGGGVGDSLLPIGTERAHKGVVGGGGSRSGGTATSAAGNQSSFPMLAPGINSSSVWSYSGSTGSHEDSDWSHQVGGAVTSDPHCWPDSVKPSQQSRSSHDIIITSQDTLQSVLASVGLTEHMELFQSNEIDLEALLLMSDKDFSEIGLPQTAQRTLLHVIGRRTAGREDPPVHEESLSVNQPVEQGDGLGYPGSCQQEDTL